jgi:hypothetical protein
MSAPEHKAAIQLLVQKYARAVDSGDGAAMAELFTSRGRVRVYAMGKTEPIAEFSGTGELTRMVEVISRTYVATLHLVTNHIIELDADLSGATGSSDCIANHYFEDDTRKENEVLPVRYRDTYAREKDSWRIARRDIHRLWTEFRPASRRPLTSDLVFAGRISL